MAAVGQPVNKRCYHCGILKQIRPPGKRQIMALRCEPSYETPELHLIRATPDKGN